MKTYAYIALVLFAASACVAATTSAVEAQQASEGKRIMFLAGAPSHGYGSHEHYAGCMLLAKSLQAAMPDYQVDVYQTRWPDVEEFSGVDAIVMYCDGGGGHPVLQHLAQVDELSESGVGIICLHYGVEIPIGEGAEKFLKWIGGYFETHWSVNPHWRAEFKELPDHPITRGVRPFDAQDEWYYHMRFRPEMAGVTPILTAIPPPETLSRPDGPHSGNAHVRATAGQPQHVAWAAENENGSRGFGFTGGHFHWNWGNSDVRRLVLNAIVWAAHGEVPEQGVGEDLALALEVLQENQDEPVPDGFSPDEIQKTFGIRSER